MTDLEIDQFWNDLKRFDMCMLVTRDHRYMRSRPMKPFFDDEDGTVRFLTRRSSPKVDEVETTPQANLVFADDSDKSWISVSGAVRTADDDKTLDALWTDDRAAWLGDARDDVIALIVEPEIAEYWTYPENKLKAKWELLKGELTGEPPDAETHGKLSL